MPKLFWNIVYACIFVTVLTFLASCFFGTIWIPATVFFIWSVTWSWWIIVSLQKNKPDQVALREFFGWLDEDEEHLLGSGLHFVPWFFELINLRRFSTNQRTSNYSKTKSTAFYTRTLEVRTDKDGNTLPLEQQLKAVKAQIDATVLWEPAWKHAEQLARLVRAGVPIDDDAKFASWIFGLVSNDIVDMIGKEPYTAIMGGKANNRLTSQLKSIIQEPTHIFFRSGLFGRDPLDNGEGTGVFEFKIEFVHLPDNVSAAIDGAEAEKYLAEAAEYKSIREATENIGAFIESLVQGGYGTKAEVKAMISGDDELKKGLLELSTKLTLNDQVMKGGGTLFKLELPPGLGDLNNAIATGIALLKGLGGGTNTPKPNLNPSGGGATSSRDTGESSKKTGAPSKYDVGPSPAYKKRMEKEGS